MTVEQPINPPVPAQAIRADIRRVREHLLFASGDYEVYLLRSADAPSLMQELYRLREITFRAVGEGTGLPLDTDVYDAYYRQMILWNVPNGEIAGAYRLGFGPEIMKEYGIEGFYTASLFKFQPQAADLLGQSIELGRSFVAPKYQREIFPLKMLLAGLAVSSLSCPSARYYMGPVSMSAAMPHYYQTLAVHYILRDFALPGAAAMVGCTHPFVPDPACQNPDELLSDVPVADIDAFDHKLAQLSGNEHRLPVLFRKYFSCSARVACFNVDPLFSNSLDGLIFLAHSTYPKNTLRSLMRCPDEETRNKVWLHFYGEPFNE